MLQRQIMFKQLQELQRRRQLQDLGAGRNQDYVSLKQASAVQFGTTVNGTPVHDSQMLLVDNMQMMQQGESSIFQGFPSGLVLSQSHGNALGSMGLSLPQFDVSLYNTPGPNNDKNFSLYSHLQDPSNHSANLSTKNSSIPLGMSSMHPSALGSSFVSRQGNFSSDQISAPDGSLLSNQVFQDKNLFGKVPFQSFNSDLFSVNYSQQGITLQRNASVMESEGKHEDSGWPGISQGRVTKLGMSEADASLDPLEQKILYNMDDQSWGSSFGTSNNMGTGGFDCTVENPSFMDTMPSIQSGSWSALMQSAVAETSSSDTAVQEEWSGLSFQNPEPSSDNQPSNFGNSEKPLNNWVDRNLQNVSSPSSEPEHYFQKSNMKCSFPGFQQSGQQYLNQNDEFQSKASYASVQYSPSNVNYLADYNSRLKHPTGGGSQLVQTSLPSETTWSAQYKENSRNGPRQPNNLSPRNEEKPCISFSGRELKDNLWLHGTSSSSVSGGSQTPFDQLNQLNIHRYPEELQKMDSGENVEPISAHLDASSDLHGQNVAAQSHHEPQGFEYRPQHTDSATPQSYSLFPSLSMGISSVTSLPSHHEKEYFKNQHPAPSVLSHMTTKLPAYSAASSQVNFQLKSTNSGGPEFTLPENVPVTPPSGASVVSRRVGFPSGLPTPWPDITTQQNVLSPRTNKFSSSLFQPPGSASSSLETSSGAPYEQPSQNSFKHENNVGYHEQRLGKVSFVHEDSTEMHNPTPLSRSTDTRQYLGKHYSEVDDVASGSLMTCMSQQPSDQAEQKDDETPVVPSSDISNSGHSLQQNYSLLHQLPHPSGRKFPFKCESTEYQQTIAQARELLLSGQKSLLQDKAKSHQEQVDAFSPGVKFSQEAQEDQSGKASSAAYLQNFQQMEILHRDDSQNHSIGSNQASNAAYQSHISLQMAPSWFKHYGTLKNSPVLPMYNPKAAVTAAQPFSGLTIGNLQENSMIMQVNSANGSQGSGIWPSSATALIANKHLPPSSTLPSDVTCQNLAVSKPRKRKIVAFDMVPWHKEVNSEALRPQNISVVEFEWTQASNRREEEATNEAEIVEDVLPVVRVKRRLICTTQLMQQVFRPAPAGIIFADASSNCEYLAYPAARLALGDACNLNSKLPADPSDMSPEKLKASKQTTASDFSKVVECLISRVKKLEGDLSRLDRNLSIVDIKVESQELEKFSTLNRFAKFHIKAHPSTVDLAPSPGPSTVQKTTPQRYVVALPMPKRLPEVTDCLPL